MDEEELLHLIKKSVGDTHHILNDGKPFEGLKKVLTYWLVTLLVCNLLIGFYTHLALHFYVYESKGYLIGKEILTFISMIGPLFVYIRTGIKTNMTKKEQDYLKSFFIFPVLYAFCACLPLILQSVNPYLKFQLIFSFPFSYLVTLMALYHLNGYFRNRWFFGLMIAFIIYLVLYFSFETYIALDPFKLFPMWILRIDYQLQDMNEIFVIDTLFLLVSCFFMNRHYINE